MQENKIGLFFGTFNPVHIGHMIIANFMATQTDLKEVWMVVSPRNPLKIKESLLGNYDRLHLVNLAIANNTKIKSSDIEFALPIPSYTIDTLTYLKEKYPSKKFILIMGGDNLVSLHLWKNYHQILDQYQIYIYSRPGYTIADSLQNHPSIHFFESPQMNISSTYIRNCIKKNKSVQYLLPDPVNEYIKDSNLFQ
jgi:nicotinate-nucleotide adenylyltransferase